MYNWTYGQVWDMGDKIKCMIIAVRGLEFVWRQSFMQRAPASGNWESFRIMFLTLSSDDAAQMLGMIIIIISNNCEMINMAFKTKDKQCIV